MRRAHVCGCPIDAVTMAEAVDAVDAALQEGRPMQHVAINAAKLVKLQRDDSLRRAIESCDLATADGQSVVWAARLLGEPLPERVAGIDLFDALLARAAERGYRVFLLGARQEIVEKAVRRIRRVHEGIRIVGFRNGYFEPHEEDDVVSLIEEARPDLLFVAMETPAKELFLARHRDRLSVGYAMGIGGSLDVFAGLRRRAPRWMQRAGMEWIARWVQDPKRLARRYVVGNTQFAWLVLRTAARR